ncbi:MAG: hypothetical protein J0M00_06110 [Burkholderiales bacterium]|nr:hypothetical protein [Burkholderiales bacterium]
MSAALLDDLLAEFTAPNRLAIARTPPAKNANSAKSLQSCGFSADSEAAKGCESLRIEPSPAPPITPDSQEFAGVRNALTAPQAQYSCGSSQNSQDSQGCPSQSTALAAPDLSAVAWTDGDVAAFLARRARLMRWGWPEADAERLAERLVIRDREADARVSCADCRHYRPPRCGNRAGAGLSAPEVGRELASLLQSCPGFGESK